MADQLNAIKRRHRSLTQRQGTDLCQDFEWLIAEIERLRATVRDAHSILSREIVSHPNVGNTLESIAAQVVLDLRTAQEGYRNGRV